MEERDLEYLTWTDESIERADERGDGSQEAGLPLLSEEERKELPSNKAAKEHWEERKRKAEKKLKTARGKATIKRLSREIQVCQMYLRDL